MPQGKQNERCKKVNNVSTVAKGRAYEEQVANYLQKQDYRIKERNFRCQYGEVDLIVEKESTLFFVEVKGQKKEQQSEMKINVNKKKRIIMTSIEYIRKHQLWDMGVHYDVAIITGENIRYYKDAFEGTGDWL